MPGWLDKLKEAGLQGLQLASDVGEGARYLLAPNESQVMGDEEQRPGAFRAGNVSEALRPSASRFAMNALDSAGRFAKGTAEGAGMLAYAAAKGGPTGAGLATDPHVQAIGQSIAKDPMAIPRGVKDYAVSRYGSGDALVDTLYTDPIGAASDASAVLTAGGAAAAKAPGTIGKIGRALGAVGEAADPIAGLSRAMQAERPAMRALDDLVPLDARRRPGPAEGQFGLPFEQEPIPDVPPPPAPAPKPAPAPAPAPAPSPDTGRETFSDLIGANVDTSLDTLDELGIRTSAPAWADPNATSGPWRKSRRNTNDMRETGTTRFSVAGTPEQNRAVRQRAVDENLRTAKEKWGEDSAIYGAHKALAESHPRTYAHVNVEKLDKRTKNALARFDPDSGYGEKIGTLKMSETGVEAGARSSGHLPEAPNTEGMTREERRAAIKDYQTQRRQVLAENALLQAYHELTHGAQSKGLGVLASNDQFKALTKEWAPSPGLFTDDNEQLGKGFGYWPAPPEVTARQAQIFQPGWNKLRAAANEGQPTLPGARALAQDFALEGSERQAAMVGEREALFAQQAEAEKARRAAGDWSGGIRTPVPPPVRRGSLPGQAQQRTFGFDLDPADRTLADLDLTTIDADAELQGLLRALEERP